MALDYIYLFFSPCAVETESDRAAESDGRYRELQKDDVTHSAFHFFLVRFVHVDFLVICRCEGALLLLAWCLHEKP